jgi:hypothetical protein
MQRSKPCSSSKRYASLCSTSFLLLPARLRPDPQLSTGDDCRKGSYNSRATQADPREGRSDIGPKSPTGLFICPRRARESANAVRREACSQDNGEDAVGGKSGGCAAPPSLGTWRRSPRPPEDAATSAERLAGTQSRARESANAVRREACAQDYGEDAVGGCVAPSSLGTWRRSPRPAEDAATSAERLAGTQTKRAALMSVVVAKNPTTPEPSSIKHRRTSLVLPSLGARLPCLATRN